MNQLENVSGMPASCSFVSYKDFGDDGHLEMHGWTNATDGPGMEALKSASCCFLIVDCCVHEDIYIHTTAVVGWYWVSKQIFFFFFLIFFFAFSIFFFCLFQNISLSSFYHGSPSKWWW